MITVQQQSGAGSRLLLSYILFSHLSQVHLLYKSFTLMKGFLWLFQTVHEDTLHRHTSAHTSRYTNVEWLVTHLFCCLDQLEMVLVGMLVENMTQTVGKKMDVVETLGFYGNFPAANFTCCADTEQICVDKHLFLTDSD